MYRGFESILRGRHPRDAAQIVQRICGVCPTAHATAASIALEKASGTAVPSNGRATRNLILGANYLQSHILHFYHLAGQDFTRGRTPPRSCRATPSPICASPRPSTPWASISTSRQLEVRSRVP